MSKYVYENHEVEDKHPNVDIENTKLIQQFIYNKDDIDKIEKNPQFIVIVGFFLFYGYFQGY